MGRAVAPVDVDDVRPYLATPRSEEREPPSETGLPSVSGPEPSEADTFEAATSATVTAVVALTGWSGSSLSVTLTLRL